MNCRHCLASPEVECFLLGPTEQQRTGELPDREFIHLYEDVQEALRHAQRLGLTILSEDPREGDPTGAPRFRIAATRCHVG